MHRILIKIPVPFLQHSIPVYSYGFMMMLAFITGIFLALRRARAAGIPPQAIMDIGLYSIICGIIGARLAFIITDMDTPRTLIEYIAIWHGGLTFQGGLFMALGVCVWYLHSHKLPAGKIADIFAPSLAVGIAIGRIGCYLNGCCWGRIAPHGFPLGIIFPKNSAVYHHQTDLLHAGLLVPLLERNGHHALVTNLPGSLPAPVHPTQIYTSVCMLGIFLLILLIERLPRRFDGMVMLFFLVFYSMLRFAIEFWRDDTPLIRWIGNFPGLRLGQILALLTMAGAAGAFAWLWRRNRGLQAKSPE